MGTDVEYRDLLPARVRFGFATLAHADRLDLSSASFVNREGGVAIVLLDSPKQPDGHVFVALRMYRLPRRRVRFENDVQWFCKSKKDRCRLPDRTPVTDETLNLFHPPAGWSHDARPQSGRTLFHVYRSPRAAMILQIGLGSVAEPEHPLVQAVREHLRIDPSQWISIKPSMRRIGVPKVVPDPDRRPAKARAPRKPRKAVTERRAVGETTRPAPGRAKADEQARPWLGHWPGNGSVRDWMLTGLRAADAIADVGLSAVHARAPIETLGKIGEVTLALWHADRHLQRLPQTLPSPRMCLAIAAATICFEAGDRERMEEYLAIAAATEPFHTRKVDIGYSLRSVREFRALRGILDPAEAVGDRERAIAELRLSGRLVLEALAAGDKVRARSAAEAMSITARRERDEYFRTKYLGETIEAFASLHDVAEVRRHLKMIDQDDRHDAIDPSVFVRLGMHEEALPGVRAALRKNLDAIEDGTNVNAHHDVLDLARNLRILDGLGAREEALRWLHKAAKGQANRPQAAIPAFSGAVAGLLAEAASGLGETVLARQLLETAKGETKKEPRNEWRQAGTKQWLLSRANAGMIESAIDEARRMRSPKKRRETLACLLARVERWDELHEVLDSIVTAEEACDVVWRLHFQLSEARDRGLDR